jgi:hypothetical protein
MNLAKSYHSLSRFCGEHLLRKIINKVSKTTTIKWLIGIALLSIQTIMYSQNFIDETKQWSIAYSIMDLNSYSTTYYKFSGDSIINGNLYHKLYMSSDSNQTNWTLSYYPLWWERNDSVFQYPSYSGDSLVYDFNLEEGDSFTIDEYHNKMKVDSIRYLEFGSRIRKHWFFNTGIIWIEGIGERSNLNCSSGCMCSCVFILLCFHENDSLVYQNPNYTNCYLYTDVPSIAKSNEFINLFPNPATNQITLNLPENKANAAYTLYDMQGRLQLTGKTGNTQTEINVATLPRGLYVLKIITEKEIITKKVVLQ